MNRTSCVSIVIIVATLGIVASSYVTAEPRRNTSNIVRAERFDLIDKQGQVIASLSAMGDGWPGFAVVMGGNPNAIMSVLIIKDEGVFLKVNDPKSTVETGLLLRSSGEAALEIGEFAGKAKAAIGIDKHSAPYMRLIDRSGKVITQTPTVSGENRETRESTHKATDPSKE